MSAIEVVLEEACEETARASRDIEFSGTDCGVGADMGPTEAFTRFGHQLANLEDELSESAIDHFEVEVSSRWQRRKA